MDFLEINIEKLRNGEMKNTFRALENAFEKYNIDFYLIGAFAREMWLSHIEDLPLRRTTRDIDFSLFINEYSDFTNVKEYLSSHEGFIEFAEPFRMQSPEHVIVDLLPFGGIENDRHVHLNGKTELQISVFGNMEVLNHAANIIQDGRKFKVCTLPGLCIMKLISGHEKSDRYLKDLGDFYYILLNYFTIAGEELYDTYHDDLIDENFEPSIASARMLGRQMNQILTESEDVKIMVVKHLEKMKGSFSYDDIHEMYEHERKDNDILKRKLISEILREL
jgi:predicted nucleotidyltransferase